MFVVHPCRKSMNNCQEYLLSEQAPTLNPRSHGSSTPVHTARLNPSLHGSSHRSTVSTLHPDPVYTVRVREVGGSSPLAPTSTHPGSHRSPFLLIRANRGEPFPASPLNLRQHIPCGLRFKKTPLSIIWNINQNYQNSHPRTGDNTDENQLLPGRHRLLARR